jgi:hypothetical protein
VHSNIFPNLWMSMEEIGLVNQSGNRKELRDIGANWIISQLEMPREGYLDEWTPTLVMALNEKWWFLCMDENFLMNT